MLFSQERGALVCPFVLPELQYWDLLIWWQHADHSPWHWTYAYVQGQAPIGKPPWPGNSWVPQHDGLLFEDYQCVCSKGRLWRLEFSWHWEVRMSFSPSLRAQLEELFPSGAFPGFWCAGDTELDLRTSQVSLWSSREFGCLHPPATGRRIAVETRGSEEGLLKLKEASWSGIMPLFLQYYEVHTSWNPQSDHPASHTHFPGASPYSSTLPQHRLPWGQGDCCHSSGSHLCSAEASRTSDVTVQKNIWKLSFEACDFFKGKFCQILIL